MKLKFSIILTTALSIGCANASKDTAIKIAIASDHVSDTLADNWKDATSDRILDCKELQLHSEAQREECLGPFSPSETDKLIAAIKVLVAVQTAIKVAAECENLNDCSSETDWADLAIRINDAWNGVKPYVMIMRHLSKDK